GVKTIEVEWRDLIRYIDWTPFFQTWQLFGKYPAILEDEVVGEQAKSVFADAQKMLKTIVDEKRLTARGVLGIFPANSINQDDIAVYSSPPAPKGGEEAVLGRFLTLRQQSKKTQGAPNNALADYIAPAEAGIMDYIGAFCVTTGFGVEKRAAQLEAENDDYGAIMLKALADRLAEAFAEYLHEKVRVEIWGYAPAESLSNEDLIDEQYRGIRPAPGYPACPDHLEKKTIWSLLDVENNIGVRLTDSLAMWPASDRKSTRLN